MAAPTGLFSGLSPEMAALQEAEQQKKTNLDLAQSANPLAGSLYASYNMADQSQKQIRDIFGNPAQDSPQVKAAKEEQALQQEIAAIMQSGAPKEEIAKQVRELLLSKNKVDKANAYDQMNLNTEKTQSEISKNTAAADASQQDVFIKKAALMEPTKRLAALQSRFSKADPKVLEGVAQDPKAFIEFMVGKEVETGEGVFIVRPDGSKELIGKGVDRATSVRVNTGEKEFTGAAGKELNTVQSSLLGMPDKIATVDKQLAAVKSKPMILGSQAENRYAIASAFNTLGIGSPSNMEKLTNTADFVAAQKALVLASLDNKLGGGISNADIELIEKAFGEISSNPKALENILTRVKEVLIRQNSTMRKNEARLLRAVETGKPEAVQTNVPEPTDANAPKPLFKSRQDLGAYAAANKERMMNKYMQRMKGSTREEAAQYVDNLLREQAAQLKE